MIQRNRYFNIVVATFWILLSSLILIRLLRLGEGIYDDDRYVRRLTATDSSDIFPITDTGSRKQKDTLNHRDTTREVNDYITKRWNWKSSKGIPHSITFKVRKSDYASSIYHRTHSSSTGYSLWGKMYNHDRAALQDMIRAYRDLIVKEKMDYFTSMDVVVTSIQDIPYTYVISGDERCGQPKHSQDGNYPLNNCRPMSYPFGCCDDVIPYGVYSPMEFVVQETGDCDTKSLMAYVILEELNPLLSGYGYYYDVTMMMGRVSEKGWHAMLGINIPNPPYRSLYAYDIRRNKYYAWEITAGNCLPGQRIWDVFEDWEAKKLK